MKKYMFGAGVACLVLCTSCYNDSTETSQFIHVTTSINSSTEQTRVSTDAAGEESFSEGDVISVYAWTGDADKVANLVVNGTANTLTDGNWQAENLMLWSDMVTPHYFLGVYPERTITDFTADTYELAIPDSPSNDLLYATSLTGLTATQNPVALNFNHAMAKLIVNLSYRNQWSATPTVSAVSVNAATQATIDYLASTPVTAAQETTDFNLTATTANLQYASIMVPQSSFQTIGITVDNQTFTYDNGKPISLVGGKVTTVNLIVGRNQITAGTISINAWEDGDTIDGGEAL